jgi:prepilin-type N-terminal cleavage/methylation domain-containing protein/prepilin-type processing-associated H-X9-DG protein
MRTASRSRGLTLVELLVVVAIIAALVALLVPAIQAARESSRRSECQNNLRQQVVAVALYANAKGAFPVGCLGARSDFSVVPPVIAAFISWNVAVLTYLDERPLHDAFNASLPSYHADNRAVAATVLPVFLCPSTVEPQLLSRTGLWKGAACADYAGIYGVEGLSRSRPADDDASLQTLRDDSLGIMLYDEAVAPRQVIDGLSRTACIAEVVDRRETETEWVNGQSIFAQDEATPLNVDRDPGNEIGSPHPGGASVAFCDAHVEFLAESLDQRVLNALLTKAGGD